MGAISDNVERTPLSRLRQFVRKASELTEACEMCALPLPPTHQHLLQLEKRRIKCACDACAILFDGNVRQRYQRIPRDIERLAEFSMDDHEWDSLLIPINLAFFVYNSAVKRMVAQYPSPGGTMESSLDLEYWNVIAERNPVLQKFEADVEALLVNRIASPARYYRAPIDQCFRLVAILRKHWRGLSGGIEVWSEIDKFFRELDEMAGGASA
jgi:hypothetical protein